MHRHRLQGCTCPKDICLDEHQRLRQVDRLQGRAPPKRTVLERINTFRELYGLETRYYLSSPPPERSVRLSQGIGL
jgi:hypothetical protein